MRNSRALLSACAFLFYLDKHVGKEEHGGMAGITHEHQKRLWEEEHAKPFLFSAIEDPAPSTGVVKFWGWLTAQGKQENLHGLEICCGKGRSVLWLAEKKEISRMDGFDFSAVAITEAIKRAGIANLENKTHFQVYDATEPWPYPDASFDFAMDIFATTDIETPEGRAFIAQEFRRVLKPGGHLLVYTLSTDDSFHGEMALQHPAEEKNAFYHPTTGKFEKIFDKKELNKLYRRFTRKAEERIEKTTTFFGKEYPMKHFWLVLQKPGR